MKDTELPDRPAIERALLELLSDGRVHDDAEIVPWLIKRFDLNAEDLPVYRTGRTTFGNKIDWVKGDMGEGLRGKHLIRRAGRGRYQILPLGRAKLQES
jgi:hypothetical protein